MVDCSIIFIFIYTEFYSGITIMHFFVVSVNRIAGINALTINAHWPQREDVSNMH